MDQGIETLSPPPHDDAQEMSHNSVYLNFHLLICWHFYPCQWLKLETPHKYRIFFSQLLNIHSGFVIFATGKQILLVYNS